MARQAVLILAVVVVFGILVPWVKGFGFMDPRVMLAYGFIALLFVAPASAQAAADTAAPGLLKRLAILVLWSWGVAATILITGVITLNVAYWRGAVIWPSPYLFASVLAFALASSAAIATLAGVLARRLTAKSIKGIFRMGFLVVLLAFVFTSRLPDSWQITIAEYSTRRAIARIAWEGCILSTVLTAVFVFVLRRRRPENA